LGRGADGQDLDMAQGGTTPEALRARERMPYAIAMVAAVVIAIAGVIVLVTQLAF
jgi:hypothetical protein